jgi:Methylase involved in ubiquinone/menaquinone biosynthesis
MSENFDERNEIKRFFDGCAENWDRNCSFDRQKISAIVTLAGIKAGSRVADAACGTGVMFPEMLSRNPAKILGIDLSDRMIAGARGKFSDPRLRLLASDLFDVEETGFDTVMIFNAYPHFSDKSRLAEQIFKMLKTGGRFMIAHHDGRDVINHCHTGATVSRISRPLRSAEEEAAEFSNYFDVDMRADTPEIYFFSGTRKPDVN